MTDLPTPFERFIQGILPENPVYRQLLGLCPTLAVTSGLKPALTMAAAVGVVLLCANIIVSLICGRILFGEFRDPSTLKLLLLLVSVIIIITGVLLIIFAKGGESDPTDEPDRQDKKDKRKIVIIIGRLQVDGKSCQVKVRSSNPGKSVIAAGQAGPLVGNKIYELIKCQA